MLESLPPDLEQLATGAFALASRLATEGAQQYPQHAALQKYARVLAPPTAVCARPRRADASARPCAPGTGPRRRC